VSGGGSGAPVMSEFVTLTDRGGLTGEWAVLVLIFCCRDLERETVHTRINFGTSNKIHASFLAHD